MVKDLHSHKIDYSFLALLATVYLVMVYRYQTNAQYLFLATLAFAIIYLLWGLFHHVHTRSLHPRIVLEYFLVASLGVVIISTLLV